MRGSVSHGLRRAFGRSPNPPDGLPPQLVEIESLPHRRRETAPDGSLPVDDLSPPVMHRIGLGLQREIDEVDEDLPKMAFHRMKFRTAHVLDLLGDVLEVEFVGEIAPVAGERA
jgi:hypothetical protein